MIGVQYGDVDVKVKAVVAHSDVLLQFVSYPNRVAGVASHDAVLFQTPEES